MMPRRAFLQTLGAAAATHPAVAAAQAADPLGVRAQFPVAARRLYLNAAYIAPVPLAVAAAGRAFVDAKAEQPIGLGEMQKAADGVRGAYARLIGATADEVAFLYATSEGENIVARGLGLAAGDNVVVDELHYNTSFLLYRELERTTGIGLRIVAARDGAVHVEDVARVVDRRTRLVSVAWVSHQNGFRHDLRPLADLAHAHGAYLYVDAVQAVGMFPIDVAQADVDFMTSGTYKWLLGSFGVAPFYIRRSLLDRIPLDRVGALHIERELGDHRYRDLQDRQALRLRDPGVRSDLPAGRCARVSRAGGRGGDRAPHRGSGRSAQPRPAGAGRAGADAARQPLVDRLVDGGSGPRGGEALRGRGCRRERARRRPHGAGVAGALQHRRRHRSLPRPREAARAQLTPGTGGGCYLRSTNGGITSRSSPEP